METEGTNLSIERPVCRSLIENGISGVFLLLFACLSSVCVTANFTKPVASLKSSIDTASSAVGSYFTELNSFERDLYLEERAFDPDLRVEKTDANGKPTPLIGHLFTADSIKARMDALSLLGAYANRLAELAGSDAPQRFSSAAQALGTNVTSLSASFSQLAGTSDPTAKNYAGAAGPISQIIGVLGEFYLGKKRESLVISGIQNGAPAVNQVLDLIEGDLRTVIEPLRTTGVAEALAIRVKAYNNTKDANNQDIDARANRRAMPLAQRQDQLQGINAAAQQFDALIAFNPTEAIAGIRDAHAALLKYAQSSKTPKNFAELTSAIEALQQKAERVATAVQQIRELRKSK